MRSEDFNNLDYTYKTETVLKATFLAERFTDRAYVRLYSLDRTYIEVFFDCRSYLIIHFRAFEHTLFLLPYLENIHVTI
ncbi:hypothetical protein GCM10023149_29340 [Mucilaginibacter gynuensis]|uniref:Uncharacterized protein n=1 Tax=Mucilaginibacter gynuensis TaxID=1302236 RepID=A0ABP8GLD2_9SPHI